MTKPKHDPKDVYVNGVRKITYANPCREMREYIKRQKSEGRTVEVRAHK